MVAPFDAQSAARRLVEMADRADQRPVVDRATFLPIGQYEDGGLTFAWPGFLKEAWDGAQRSYLDAAHVPVPDAPAGSTWSGPLDAFNAASIAPMAGVAGRATGAIPRGSLGSGGSDMLQKSKGVRPEPDALNSKAGAMESPVSGSGILAETTNQTISYGPYKSQDPWERAKELRSALMEARPDLFEGITSGVTTSQNQAGRSAYFHTTGAEFRLSDHYANPHYRPGQFDVSYYGTIDDVIRAISEVESRQLTKWKTTLDNVNSVLERGKPPQQKSRDWQQRKRDLEQERAGLERLIQRRRGGKGTDLFANPDTAALPAIFGQVQQRDGSRPSLDRALRLHDQYMMGR